MDMITLAMAKADSDYTIDFDALEMSIAQIVLTGGGSVTISDKGAVDRYIAEAQKKPKYALMSAGPEAFRCAIAVLNDNNMGFFLIAKMANRIITAKIYISVANNAITVDVVVD